ncbi:MAG TPA: winged helix-turn-helix domain-containing protein [Terriglobia bacterium]|nr:winged helix-turn-helix domain-containing protein [Terriglobia bacterium]
MGLKSKQLEFGSFRVDTASQLLLRDRKPIPLTPKAFDTLLFLLQNAHRLVTREELMKAVWPDSFVEDGNVSVNIFQLRKVLGETEGGRPFIETVPRKGYRFNAEVRTVEVETADGPLSPPLVLQPVETGRPVADAPEVKDNDGLGSNFRQGERAGARDAGAIVRGGALREVIPFLEPKRTIQPQPPLEQNRPTEVPATISEPARSRTALRRWAFLAGICLIVLGLIAAWSLWHYAQRPAQMVQRRLTSFAPEMAVTAAAVSTGDKFIAYAIPAGLFVQVISTGETRALPLPGPHFVVSSISWFPDSASLLVDGSAPQDATLGLWIVPVIGTNPPIKLGSYPAGTVSPDGSQIALVNNHGAAPEIQLMSAQGGGVRTLVTGGGGETFGSVRWFDDGRRLLFVRYRWNAQFRRNAGSIDAYDLARGKTETIMAGSDFGGDAVSLPDGGIVYSKIAGANPATSGAEVMEVRTNRGSGKASGAPALLAKWDAPVTDMTVNAAGSRLVLRDMVVQHDIYMADLKNGGTSLAGVGRFSFGVGRDDFARAWTPDSRAVFVDTNRNGNWQIYKRTLDSESDSPFVAGSDDQFSPRVSPDGAWLLYLERPRHWRETEPVDLMRVPIAGGLPQLVLAASGFSDWGLRFECPRRAGMPCILAQRQGSQVVFQAFDPVKGLMPSNREIARCDAPAPIQWTLAPDGSGLAWINRNSGEIIIYVLSLTKSPYGFAAGRSIEFAIEGWSNPRSIQWAPGGDGWFLVSSSESGWTLLYINPSGKPDVLLRNPGNWAPDVYPSPDGRHLAFSKQNFSSNVWTLTHF